MLKEVNSGLCMILVLDFWRDERAAVEYIGIRGGEGCRQMVDLTSESKTGLDLSV